MLGHCGLLVPGEPVAHKIMGYFSPKMVYFGVWWPVISSYLAVQVLTW